MLSRRQNNVLQATSGSTTEPQFAASFVVYVYSSGALANAASSDTTPTVDAGHSLVANDKILVWDGTSATFVAEALTSTTATGLTFSSATPSISSGDRLVNLGPDTASGSTPAFDAGKVPIFSDPDGSTSISGNKITTDAQGNYGYYHKGDGRLWEVITNAAGTVVAVLAGFGGVGGRINIADFGAAIDGSTDNAPEVNIAILCQASIGGGDVFFPEGDCRVAATITMSSNVNLIGEGIGSKISIASGTLDLITCTAVSQIRISRLFLEGNGKNTTSADDGGDGIQIDGDCSRIFIEQCHLEKFDDAIRCGPADEINVVNCTGVEIAQAFFHWLGTTNSNVSGCQFDGARSVGDAANALNFGFLSFGGSPLAPCKNCSMTSNQIQNTSFEAFVLKAAFCSVVGNVIDNCGSSDSSNISLGSHSGETVQPVQGGTYCTVVGNVMRNPGFLGIGVDIASGSNTLSGHHNVIMGNIIESAGSSAISLQTDASDNTVSNNLIDGAVSHGIVLGATASRNLIQGNRVENTGTTTGNKRGILIQGGTGNTISGNFVDSTDTHGIYMSGTCIDTSIIGNVVIDAGKTNTTVDQNGIYDNATSTRTFISGNRCFSQDTTHQKFGIAVSTNATDAMVIGNDCSKNTSTTDGMELQVGATRTVVINNRIGNTALVAVASATTINLPLDSDTISVTGATGPITTITAMQPGKIATLIFASTPTVDELGNIKLSASFTASADDVLVLACDGTNWFEVSRSVN